MTTGAVVLLAAVAFAAAFGAWRLYADGRFGRVAAQPSAPSLLAQTRWSADLGERATFLQFSSAFCAPCRSTRRVLADVADVVPGVRHIEVDAEQHLELVRELNVLRTPTTLVLDASGTEVTRAAGAPTKEQVLSALAKVV